MGVRAAYVDDRFAQYRDEPGRTRDRGNWNQNPRPFVWTNTAEDILHSLAKYIAKISGRGTLVAAKAWPSFCEPNWEQQLVPRD